MARFAHGPVEIDYLDEGEGDPVVLVHGFASTKEINWAFPGWVTTLRRAGRRAVALDNRGHGRSTKLYRPQDYTIALMASDVRALVDHLGLERADFIGYSMGARICAHLAVHATARVRSAVLAGVGMSLVTGRSISEIVAAALEAPSLADVSDPTGRTFRAFAEQTRSDLRALAACIRGSGDRIAPADMAAVRVPILVAAGTADAVAGPAPPLAAMIPGAQLLDIPGRDHMRAVGDQVFKDGTLAFLNGRR
ncbi:MAG TPA: alpha/beta fold hydrolase [Xanthobacteraceae bacterium]|nr:alpha/beta fold hydrolase [Xanthobacteraceae bacterium]